MTAVLEARDLAVRRGGVEVVRVPALLLHEGEILGLLGPNGAGKTSLVLALAGLVERSGLLRFRGQDVTDQLAYRRRIGVVFQRPLLLDRSVRDNAELGLALRGVSGPERRHRAEAALGRLGIAHLAGRAARTLSGGEAQRVSIARALALAPEILFLDEPFAGLDQPTREELSEDLSGVLREQRASTVLVTHSREEARALADRIAVMIGGAIRQVGPAAAVFEEPADREVAGFLGVGRTAVSAAL